MKTTIEIADSLFAEARRIADADGTTLRALVEEGLRAAVARRAGRAAFTLRDESVPGEGLRPDLQPGDWPALRAAIYEGQGG
jgi:Arc/MetJ family transcription regulator